jgi:hypothetical protein
MSYLRLMSGRQAKLCALRFGSHWTTIVKSDLRDLSSLRRQVSRNWVDAIARSDDAECRNAAQASMGQVNPVAPATGWGN